MSTSSKSADGVFIVLGVNNLGTECSSLRLRIVCKNEARMCLGAMIDEGKSECEQRNSFDAKCHVTTDRGGGENEPPSPAPPLPFLPLSMTSRR